MKHLTTTDNILNGGRPVSAHLDSSRIEIYIDEAEQEYIKKRLGDALFIDLTQYVNTEDKNSFPFEYKTLLDGGEYEVNICGEKEKRTFKGLVATLNYYVYAKIVKNNNFTATRFGFVEKEDPHSKNAELKERLVVEKDALSIADIYMSECIEYLKADNINIPLFKKAGKAKNRLNIKIIGD